MNIKNFEETVNEWGQRQVPFLFMVDFEMQKPVAIKLSDITAEEISYEINGKTNVHRIPAYHPITTLRKHPISYNQYKEKFDLVFEHLLRGNSYLTNLTIKTEIESRYSLAHLFYLSQAKYKVLFKDEFLVFSPETFIKINGNRIFTYPMKGTINASVPDAANIILNDLKELAEHTTIVDLLRNDLSQIASNVAVTRFRYIDEIHSNEYRLLQVSSEIVGDLKDNTGLGTLLVNLLPAGSISGAPKKKTVDIIKRAEGEERGYYTGVVGIYDGETLDSGVMIRFIERSGGKYYYRSGGGITILSKCELEYKEALEKIYVPVN
jgi:para-aminobenzoate synthetase component 1